MKVMLVILVMQVMQVMQVLQVSGAHLWVIFNISNNIYNLREDILISWSNIGQVYETTSDWPKSETRLTYNCAHLRSTKQSLTIWVKIFLGENFWGENFFEWKFFGWIFFSLADRGGKIR